MVRSRRSLFGWKPVLALERYEGGVRRHQCVDKIHGCTPVLVLERRGMVESMDTGGHLRIPMMVVLKWSTCVL
jgi:hypothetical protein